VAHSNPDVTLPAPNNTAAVYTLTLSGSTALLKPLFGVNDAARVVNPAPGAPKNAPLGLTDPDSNRFIPGQDGGRLIQDAQADSKLVFVSHLHAKDPVLRQLDLTNATPPTAGKNPDGSAVTPQLDDIVRVSGRGVLYVVDQKGNNVYALETTGMESGTYFVSQPKPSSGDMPNDAALAVVDPETGVVTHVDQTLISPKGLLFLPAVQR
jgi:hypothetical protein